MKTIFTLSIFILAFTVTKANIIYTDVIPDSVKSGNDSLFIDVNNDLTFDFRITSAQAGNFAFDIVQAGGMWANNFVLSDGAGNASALALNTVIGSSSTTWYQMNNLNLQMMQVFNSVGSGTWSGATDKYLGLKFIVTSNTYYGWARFTVDVNTNMYTFKDYAYETTPNQQILAGQTVTGINNLSVLEHSVSAFPNPAQHLITIHSNVSLSQTNIQLMNVTGAIVYDSSSEIFTETTINISKFARGVYMLRIENEKGILTKKIVIE